MEVVKPARRGQWESWCFSLLAGISAVSVKEALVLRRIPVEKVLNG